MSAKEKMEKINDEGIDKGYQYVYLLGVCGMGVSSLAQYFAIDQAAIVFGYDQTLTPFGSELVQKALIRKIFTNTDLEHERERAVPNEIRDGLPTETLVVYSEAISPETCSLLSWFIDGGYQTVMRSKCLGQILGHASKNTTSIAVSGVHGKTTTTALLAHIFHQFFTTTERSEGMRAFIGGVVKGYESNYIRHFQRPIQDSSSEVSVVSIAEACEFNRSFLQIQPDVTIIQGKFDLDHHDTYPAIEDLQQAFNQFLMQTKSKVVLSESALSNLSIPDHLSAFPFGQQTNHPGIIHAENIRFSSSDDLPCSYFDYVNPVRCLRIEGIRLPLIGRYNIDNALAAITVALEYGIPSDHVKEIIGTFPGIRRRAEVLAERKRKDGYGTRRLLLIRDYCHHPTEIQAFLTALPLMIGGEPPKKTGKNRTSSVIIIFQSSVLVRMRSLLNEYAACFSDPYFDIQLLFLLSPCPSRHDSTAGGNQGTTVQDLWEKIQCKRKYLCPPDLASFRQIFVDNVGPKNVVDEIDAIVLIGAGKHLDSPEIVNVVKDALFSCE